MSRLGETEQQRPQQVKPLNLNVINSYYDNLRKITQQKQLVNAVENKAQTLRWF